MLSIQQWNEVEWRMCLTVLVCFLCFILPGSRLQVENCLLSCYVAVKMCVSSPLFGFKGNCGQAMLLAYKGQTVKMRDKIQVHFSCNDGILTNKG